MTSDNPAPISGPPRTISLFTAICIVVANMIGTGVFTSLGYEVGPLPSGFAIITLWLVGGLCALCGALAYGELAAALPRSGGEYHLLSAIYHPAAGFLAGWVSITVGFAAPVAMSAMGFASYLEGALGMSYGADFRKVLSIVLVAIVTGIHLIGGKAGSRFQDISTVLKVVLILALIIAGAVFAHPQPIQFTPLPGDGGRIASAAFATSLVFVMYSYSGWNSTVYIVGEVKNPRRDVPLSVVIGTILVTILYVALNAMMLRAAPLAALQDKLQVAAVAAVHIFGALGGRVVSGLICAGLIASVSAMIFIGPRVSMAMGEDWRSLRFLARQSARGLPSTAIVVQSLITVALIVTMRFDQVVTCISFSLAVCSFLTVLGVYVLRVRQPLLPRPTRAWGYPVTPFIFLAVNLWMLVFTFRNSPKESLIGLGIMALGLVVYALSPKARPSAPTASALPPSHV